MCWHTWNKMLVVSFSLAAAGIVVCAAALLDSIVARGSILATIASMAVLGVGIIVVLAGYVWACDKCQDYLSAHLDRLLGKRLRKPSDELSPKEPPELGDAKHRMRG